MSELYPTKTRLALLHAVAEGNVYRANNGHDYHLAADKYMPQMVNATAAEQRRAGWVELTEPTDAGIAYWYVTDAGRAVLDANGGAS